MYTKSLDSRAAELDDGTSTFKAVSVSGSTRYTSDLPPAVPMTPIAMQQVSQIYVKKLLVGRKSNEP